MAVLKDVEEPHSTVTELISQIEEWRGHDIGLHLIDEGLFSEWLPRFFYFSDYSTMRGKVSLPDLKAKEAAGTLDESDKTFLSLLETVDADLSDFEQVDFELSPASSRARRTASPMTHSPTGGRTPACG